MPHRPSNSESGDRTVLMLGAVSTTLIVLIEASGFVPVRVPVVQVNARLKLTDYNCIGDSKGGEGMNETVERIGLQELPCPCGETTVSNKFLYPSLKLSEWLKVVSRLENLVGLPDCEQVMNKQT